MKLDERIEVFRKEFKENESFKVRKFLAFDREFALLYIEEFADFDLISKDIIKPILESKKEYKDKQKNEEENNKILLDSDIILNNFKEHKKTKNNENKTLNKNNNLKENLENEKNEKKKAENDKDKNEETEGTFPDFIAKEILYSSELNLSSDLNEIIKKLTRGEKILLIENEISAILINTKKLEKRAIVEPPNNNVIRGPREGFIEDINTNINLIKKRLVTTDLNWKIHEKQGCNLLFD